jgi:two-component system LytT family response regulator
MKKVVIIDDEALARSIVKEYLAYHKEFLIVAECANGFEGVKAIMQHQPDLIFLDIQMPKINGFEMLELLDSPPGVIFTTAFEEFAVKAFERHAVDYLLKPFSRERFNNALTKWLQQGITSVKGTEELLHHVTGEAEDRSRIVVRNNSEINIVPVAEIQYIEAFDDYVKIFTKDNFHLKKKTMSYFESFLPADHFLRVHRSFIINLGSLTRIEPIEKNSYFGILRLGKKIPLSRAGYVKLKDKLGI